MRNIATLIQLFFEIADNAGAMGNPSEWVNSLGLSDEQAAQAQELAAMFEHRDGVWQMTAEAKGPMPPFA